MANYVEYIKVGTGESWRVRDIEAHDRIGELENSTSEITADIEAMQSDLDGLNDSVTSIKSSALMTSGGIMAGDIDMDGNAMTGLPDPSNDTDPATKGYVDNKIANVATVDVVIAIEADTPVEVSLQEGEAMNFTYCTSATGENGVTLLVNSNTPSNSAYHFGSENWTNRIITQCGAACQGDFTGTMRVLNGRIHLSGSGLRGNGSGIGHAAMQWQSTTAVETLTFSQPGTLAYRKL